MPDTSAPRLVVYGAGAIGGVLAARLVLAGIDVTAVARGEHLDAVRASGLTLVDDTGQTTVRLSAVANAGEVDWSDDPIVMIAVKSHQTQTALDDLAAHAPRRTPVFAAQNGVANERAALRRFSEVYGVAVLVSAAHLEPGVVVQQSHPVAGILDLGRYPSGGDDVAQRVSAMFRAAQFLSEVRPDIMAWKYRKLIANLGNGVTATHRPSSAAEELVARARTEAERVLATAGIDVITADRDRERRGEVLNGRVRADYFGSTWQSVARGRVDVETDWFNGEIVLQARLLGLTAPVNELLQRVTAEYARSGRPPRTLDAEQTLARLATHDSLTG